MSRSGRAFARPDTAWTGTLIWVCDLGLSGLAKGSTRPTDRQDCRIESPCTVAEVEAIAKATGLPVLALKESARGIAPARPLAEASARLVFGSIDYAADLGCAHTRETV